MALSRAGLLVLNFTFTTEHMNSLTVCIYRKKLDPINNIIHEKLIHQSIETPAPRPQRHGG